MAFYVTKLETYLRTNGDVATTSAEFWRFLTEEKAQAYADGLLKEHFDNPIGDRMRENPNIEVFGEGTKSCSIHFRMDFPGKEGHGKLFSVETYTVSSENPMKLDIDYLIPWGETK